MLKKYIAREFEVLDFEGYHQKEWVCEVKLGDNLSDVG